MFHLLLALCRVTILCVSGVLTKQEQQSVPCWQGGAFKAKRGSIMTENDEQRFGEEPHGKLSRRQFLEGTLEAALASAGIYELIDTLVQAPERVAFAASQPLPPEQYAIPTPRLIMDDGSGVASSTGTIPILIPPLHNHVITATPEPSSM